MHVSRDMHIDMQPQNRETPENVGEGLKQEWFVLLEACGLRVKILPVTLIRT